MNTYDSQGRIAVRISNAVALGLGAGLVFGGGLVNFFLMFVIILLSCFVERPLYPLILLGLLAQGHAYGPLRDMGLEVSSATLKSLTFSLLVVTVGGTAWIGSNKLTTKLRESTSFLSGGIGLAFLPVLYFFAYLALTVLMVNIFSG